MAMMKFVVFAALAALALAQVPHEFSAYSPTYSPSRTTASEHMPAMKIEENMAKARVTEEIFGAWEFGQINKVDLCLFSNSTIVNYPAGTLRKLAFSMPNALSMAFHFDHFHIPEGAALFVVSEKETAGPFTHLNNYETGVFQTRHVEGSHVELHYFETPSVNAKPHVHVAVVTTAFRAPNDGSSNAGKCNVNAICIDSSNKCTPNCKPTDSGCSVQCTYIDQDVNKGQWAGPEWNPQVRGTVALGSNFASRYCSGSFINNKEGRQLVLTAAHCSPSGSDIVLMNFDNPDCKSASDSAGSTKFVAGNIKTLASNANIDNELLEIGEAIPDDWHVYLSGYDSTDEKNPAVGAVGIHHPSGSNKKISYLKDAVVPGRWSGGTTDNHWRINAWTVATTEPGSSGSPLFSHKTKRIIGQLHGGSAACPAQNGYDLYGAVWAGYNLGGMSAYLGAPFMDGEELKSAKARRLLQ